MSEIRSYRSVFDLERRIYSIDRLRLNPSGIPVRGVVYFVSLLALFELAAAVPLLGSLVRVAPWYLRDVALPALIAALMTAIRLDGRAIHLVAGSLARLALAPRRSVALSARSTLGERWRPAEMTVIPDGSDSGFRQLRYTGPGSVLVLCEHDLLAATSRPGRLRAARDDLRLRAVAGAPPAKGKVVILDGGARLLVQRAHGAERW